MYIPKGRWGVRADKLSAQALSHDLVPYLQFLAVLIVNGHGHLHVLGRCLTAFIEIPMDQSHIDVVPHITCVGDRKAKKKKVKKKIRHSRKNKIILFLPKDTLVEPKKTTSSCVYLAWWSQGSPSCEPRQWNGPPSGESPFGCGECLQAAASESPTDLFEVKEKKGKVKKGWEFI